MNFLWTITLWYLFFVFVSCGYDLWTYPRRQDEWERAHPGETYIRNYRKLVAQGEI